MECYCYLRNVQDLLEDGRTAIRRTRKGPIIPCGAMGEYFPNSAKYKAPGDWNPTPPGRRNSTRVRESNECVSSSWPVSSNTLVLHCLRDQFIPGDGGLADPLSFRDVSGPVMPCGNAVAEHEHSRWSGCREDEPCHSLAPSEICHRWCESAISPDLKASIADRAFPPRYSEDDAVEISWESLRSTPGPKQLRGVERHHRQISTELASILSHSNSTRDDSFLLLDEAHFSSHGRFPSGSPRSQPCTMEWCWPACMHVQM